MPLIFANSGEDNIIRKVSGNPEIRTHLEDMGFVPGAMVQVITTMNGNLIVRVKETRVAISKEMAQRIMI